MYNLYRRCHGDYSKERKHVTLCKTFSYEIT